jgi:DNA modification methylase
VEEGCTVTPYFTDSWLSVYQGDCREVLPTLPDASVDCVVTSPPFWGLRDYGHPDQLGLEPTPEQYVANLVAVFREGRRVLKPSGTVWLNLGDSYAGSGPSGASYQSETTKRRAGGDGIDGAFRVSKRLADRGLTYAEKKPVPPPGLKPKDLVGIPWRVAFALQADGWYLRSDIIWSKPNPMPESVTDRPTKAHEYVFLLTKSARYFFDQDAVRENGSGQSAGNRNYKYAGLAGHETKQGIVAVADVEWTSRNLRSVWTIATRPYPGAHFAVFPPELPERCIKAGSPEGGVVLDPFAGSGTVGLVANRLSRRAILIDLNADYITQQMRRNAQTPLGLSEPVA